MKLQPRLVKSTVLLSFGERVVSGKDQYQVEQGRKEIDAEVWGETGLAIHEYHDEVDRKQSWRITHMESGRSILRHMKSREQAIEYLIKVKEWETIEGLNVNWNMTEKQFKDMYNREEVIVMLNGLQKQISGERR